MIDKVVSPRQLAMTRLRGAQRLLFSITTLLLFYGCNPHTMTEPRPLVGAPEYISTEKGAPVHHISIKRDGWWLIFDDPVLHKLIAMGLRQNLDVKDAYERLRFQYSILKEQRARFFPIITGDYSLSRSRRPGFFGKDLGTDYRYGATLNYELDVWKKIASGVSASAFEANATEEDLHALQIMIGAEIATTYFTLNEALIRRDLLAAKRRALKEKLDMVRSRYRKGTVDSDILYRVEGELTGLEAQIHALDGEIAREKDALWVLLGEYPKEDLPFVAVDLKRPPSLPQGSIPLSLLLRRPDVRAAALRVRAQDERVAAAISEWFPALGVNLSYGKSRNASSFGIISGIFWSVAFQASATFFEGGARQARIEGERSRLVSSLIQYQRAVLNAFKETMTSASRARQADNRLNSTEKGLYCSERQYQLARSRFRQGIESGTEVLDSQAAYIESKVQYNQALLDAILTRVDIVRAIGGAWK